MMLAAGKDTVVTIHAEGGDAEEALNQIQTLFDDKFGEEQ